MVLIKNGSSPDRVLRVEYRAAFFKRPRVSKIWPARRKKKKRRQKRTHYSSYIKSNRWRDRRIAYYRTYGKTCIICGGAKRMTVHHMSYRHLGYEHDADLVALCWDHHDAFHDEYGVKLDMKAETVAFIEEQQQLLEFPQFR